MKEAFRAATKKSQKCVKSQRSSNKEGNVFSHGTKHFQAVVARQQRQADNKYFVHSCDDQ